MCMCIPNIKFLCLALYQGEVCTDDNDANYDDDANNDGQSVIVTCSLVDKPNEPKSISYLPFNFTSVKVMR